MPELPEVETIASILRRGSDHHPSLLGKTILDAHLLWERTLAYPSPAVFQEKIIGQVIHEIGRRGKFLLLSLSKGALLIHLRMSGDLLVESSSNPPATHHRLMLDLDGGLRLSFNDPRKFGRVWLVADPQIVLGSLGPEPLSPDFTPHAFYERLQRHNRQLKPLLLDQTFLAGLGNIYADEALHRAKLHPKVNAATLNRVQAEQLWMSIRQVLQEGIQHNGASIDWVYRGGEFQHDFRVYRRNGKPCPVCGTPIQRIAVGQRSTHFCPSCQPLPQP